MPTPTDASPANDAAPPTANASGNHALTARLSMMMFLQYASLGLWNVTLGSYITSNTGDAGRAMFDSDFVGDLLVIQALGALVAPIVFGVIADRHFSTEKLLSLLHIASAACLCVMAACREQWMFYLGTLAYFQAFTPTGALTSNLALRHLPNGQRGFPFVRAMGTAGWIAAGLVVGIGWRTLTGESIEYVETPMWLAAGCHLLTALYCFTLPETPALGRMVGGWRALAGGGSLWRNPSFVVLIVLSALVMAPAQFYVGFVHPFLGEKGLGFEDAASKLSLGQAGEVLVMITLPWFLARFRLKTLFLVGAVAWSVRFGMFFVCGSAEAMTANTASWLAYSAVLLHGFAFVYVYLTGQLYIDRLADHDARAAAQGVHTMAIFGVGNMIGAFAVGAAQARYLTPEGVDPAPYDWPAFWLVACAMSTAGAVLFAVLFREQAVSPSVTTTASDPASDNLRLR